MVYKNRIIYIASELKQNFKIMLLSGVLAVVNMVQPIDTLATTYNFEVEQTHNYFVGTEGVLVHNSCSWNNVNLGQTELSRKTMAARRASPNADVKRNFAVIEYIDLSGNTQYESFRSLATNYKGHTEAQVITFFEQQGLPLGNLKKLHSELIPCNKCAELLIVKLKNTDVEITWDFNEGDLQRLNYINSLSY